MPCYYSNDKIAILYALYVDRGTPKAARRPNDVGSDS